MEKHLYHNWYIYITSDIVRLSPLLLSVLGKKGRIKILETLYKYPKRAFTINELARESAIPVMTCWRSVKEFESLEVVKVDTVGKTFAVRLNVQSPIVKDLENAKLTDVHRDSALMFSKAVRKIDGVTACYLFGSVSKSIHKPGSDVDIAVIYDPKRIKRVILEELCAKHTLKILKTSGMRIIPLYLSDNELKNKNKSIVKDILSGDLLWRKER